MVKIGDKYWVGDMVMFTCKKGFVPMGFQTALCLPSSTKISSFVELILLIVANTNGT